MPAPSLAERKQKCAAAHKAFIAASSRTLHLLNAVELPVPKELRGSILQQLQVEHQAQEQYLVARQELFLLIQEQFRRP